MAKEILCQFLIEPDGKRKGDRLWEHEKEAHTLSPFHKILSPRSDRKFPLATSNSQPFLLEHDNNNNNNNKVYFSSARLKDHKTDTISFAKTSLCDLSQI